MERCTLPKPSRNCVDCVHLYLMIEFGNLCDGTLESDHVDGKDSGNEVDMGVVFQPRYLT